MLSVILTNKHIHYLIPSPNISFYADFRLVVLPPELDFLHASLLYRHTFDCAEFENLAYLLSIA